MYQLSVQARHATSIVRTPPESERIPSVAKAPLAVPITPNVSILSLIALLSSREHEIARLVARGLSNKEVAIELAISPWTVSAHLRRIFTKLDIKRRIELCLLMAHC